MGDRAILIDDYDGGPVVLAVENTSNVTATMTGAASPEPVVQLAHETLANEDDFIPPCRPVAFVVDNVQEPVVQLAQETLAECTICPCQTDVEEPGPHIPSCPWNDEVACVDCGCDLSPDPDLPGSEQRCDADRDHHDKVCGDDCPVICDDCGTHHFDEFVCNAAVALAIETLAHTGEAFE